MDQREPPRLYLLTPARPDAAALAKALEAALGAGDVACLLADFSALPEADAARALDQAKKLCARHDTALLLRDARAAKTSGADGAHVSVREGDPEAALKTAAKILKPELILGAGGMRSKHAAMSAGESDVDYVMFGEPAPDGYTPPLEQTLERTQWWAEIFNVPCVAHAAVLADIAPLAEAGADFVSLREAVWDDPRGPAGAIVEALALLRRVEARQT